MFPFCLGLGTVHFLLLYSEEIRSLLLPRGPHSHASFPIGVTKLSSPLNLWQLPGRHTKYTAADKMERRLEGVSGRVRREHGHSEKRKETKIPRINQFILTELTIDITQISLPPLLRFSSP